EPAAPSVPIALRSIVAVGESVRPISTPSCGIGGAILCEPCCGFRNGTRKESRPPLGARRGTREQGRFRLTAGQAHDSCGSGTISSKHCPKLTQHPRDGCCAQNGAQHGTARPQGFLPPL